MEYKQELEMVLEVVKVAGNTGILVYGMFLLESCIKGLVFFGGILLFTKTVIESIKWHKLKDIEQRDIKSKGYEEVCDHLQKLRYDLVTELNKELKEIQENR